MLDIYVGELYGTPFEIRGANSKVILLGKNVIGKKKNFPREMVQVCLPVFFFYLFIFLHILFSFSPLFCYRMNSPMKLCVYLYSSEK